MTIEEIAARRVALGGCRHCGGPVPCWSSFGDRAPGKQHTRGLFEMMKQGATAEGARFVRQDLDSRRGTGVGLGRSSSSLSGVASDRWGSA